MFHQNKKNSIGTKIKICSVGSNFSHWNKKHSTRINYSMGINREKLFHHNYQGKRKKKKLAKLDLNYQLIRKKKKTERAGAGCFCDRSAHTRAQPRVFASSPFFMQMLGVAQVTGSQIITQGLITIFCSRTVFCSRTNFLYY